MSSKSAFSRRRFLKIAAIAGAGVAVPAVWTRRISAQIPSPVPDLIDPKGAPGYLAAVQFKKSVRVPPALDATSGKKTFEIEVEQANQDLGVRTPDGRSVKTKIFGYNGIYPGPTFLCASGKPVKVKWVNDLPASHILDPIDTQTIMSSYVPGHGVTISTHVHGGHTDAAFDGLPDAWYKYVGKKIVSGPLFPGTTTYTYDNSQEGGTVWYHDHALGITRQNVYAGMAGFFLILDENDIYLVSKNRLPARQYEFGLAIQDRLFTTAGQLYYPNYDPDTPTLFPTMFPEVFGNFMLVNGVVWPHMDVEPRPYRFRLLNGCDSRFLHLYFDLASPPPFFQIGTELGLLDEPVDVNRLSLPQLTDPTYTSPTMRETGLLLAPGERADVVIDFSGHAGQTLVLRNDANAPMPGGDPANFDPDTVGQVMQFRVTKPLDRCVPKSKLPDDLRPKLGDLPRYSASKAKRTRRLILFETPDDGFGRLQPMLGTVDQGAIAYYGKGLDGNNDGITEVVPKVGDLEIWEIYNTTPDLHPIHLHLVAHQVLGRFTFTGTIDQFGHLTITSVDKHNLGLEGNEHGWKDTTHMWPGTLPNPEEPPYPASIEGQMTRIIARFDKPGLYVWHCHILSHEEHDMMRPFYVGSHPPVWPPV